MLPAATTFSPARPCFSDRHGACACRLRRWPVSPFSRAAPPVPRGDGVQSGDSSCSLGVPLFSPLRPIVQALPDLALEAAVGRIVEFLPAKRLGEVILAGERFLG